LITCVRIAGEERRKKKQREQINENLFRKKARFQLIQIIGVLLNYENQD